MSDRADAAWQGPLTESDDAAWGGKRPPVSHAEWLAEGHRCPDCGCDPDDPEGCEDCYDIYCPCPVITADTTPH